MSEHAIAAAHTLCKLTLILVLAFMWGLAASLMGTFWGAINVIVSMCLVVCLAFLLTDIMPRHKNPHEENLFIWLPPYLGGICTGLGAFGLVEPFTFLGLSLGAVGLLCLLTTVFSVLKFIRSSLNAQQHA